MCQTGVKCLCLVGVTFVLKMLTPIIFSRNGEGVGIGGDRGLGAGDREGDRRDRSWVAERERQGQIGWVLGGWVLENNTGKVERSVFVDFLEIEGKRPKE